MTTYEKIVKGATKVKVAAPKPKYIEPILMATSIDHPEESENFRTIMRTLAHRLQDSAWSVVYKSLIVIHIMIREGDRDVTLDYVANKNPSMLNLSSLNVVRSDHFSSDVRFIVKYAKYLHTRAKQFEHTGIDYVRDERSNNSTSQSGGRLRSLSVERGLLRETESVQKQIDALLKNSFVENDVNNDVVLTAFRLLVNDLLALFQELNEGVINLLEHYFEMSKVDAERALKIYKKFVDQTKYVIDYLRVAKHLEYATRLHVPTIKHAPTALTSSLEEYLDDPNFEVNRRQYLAEKQDKKDPGSSSLLRSGGNNAQRPSRGSENPPSRSPSNNYQNTDELNRKNSLLVQQSTYNPWRASLPVVQQQAPFVTQPDMAQQQAAMVPSMTGNGTFTSPAIQQGQTAIFQPHQTGIGQTFVVTGQAQPLQPQATNSNPFFQGPPLDGGNQQLMQQYQQQQLQLEQQRQQLQQQMQQQEQQRQQQMQQQEQQRQQQLQQQMQQQQQLQSQSQNSFSYPQPLQQQNTNPFLNFQSPQNQPSRAFSDGSTNPFTSTRFSQNGTTAFTIPENKVENLTSNSTGGNPFKVSSSTTELFNRTGNKQPQQLMRQPTAGGLETLPTVPIFPQTQDEAQRQAYLNNARLELQQQTTGNPNAQYLNQGQSWYNTHQPQAQQATTTGGFYDGPSLI
ncbi:Piso0_000152 [Millerozyma farinosa CBS 7064]|uniref:Piso0_000152 protein n=1 Tax=Pichia sorbitophila (strain ATCC MYA-4447 / BCRC 22081 / CBS 7064 / NBRC 10061 / NRRL Y-12695) TaxID=559304 RepID=G8YUN5_PICSO|nr:Piso0_000152 [Millerozyma farinosa CBS 7064]